MCEIHEIKTHVHSKTLIFLTKYFLTHVSCQSYSVIYLLDLSLILKLAIQSAVHVDILAADGTIKPAQKNMSFLELLITPTHPPVGESRVSPTLTSYFTHLLGEMIPPWAQLSQYVIEECHLERIERDLPVFLSFLP